MQMVKCEKCDEVFLIGTKANLDRPILCGDCQERKASGNPPPRQKPESGAQRPVP